MKQFTTLFLGLLITTIIFSSCNKVKDLADVTFDATFNTNLNVDETSKNTDATFSAESIIDPTSNSQVAEYLDKIKQYDITSMTAEVTDVNKNGNLVTGQMNIFTSNNDAEWNFQNLPLSLGATIVLDNDNGQWGTVQQILGEQTSFTVKMEGETDEDGMIFTVKVTIQTIITANPL